VGCTQRSEGEPTEVVRQSLGLLNVLTRN
jgi:hypothetical protein